MSEHSLDVARNGLEQLRIEDEAAEIRDKFTERARQLAERQAETEADERRREAEANAQRQHSEWRNRLLEMALDQIPPEAPPETRLRTIRTIEATLNQLDSTRSERVTQCEIAAALEAGLAEYLRAKEADQAMERRLQAAERTIETVVGRLPRILQKNEAVMRDARQAAAQAIADLGEGATPRDMEMAAEKALRRFHDAARHIERCGRYAAVAFSFNGLPDATPEERGEVAEALASALCSKLQPGFSEGELQQASAAELSRLRAALQQRHEQAAVEQDRREKEKALGSVLTWLPEDAKKRALDDLRGGPGQAA